MKWLLDTNACIRYLNGRAPGIRTRLDAVNSSDVCLCSIVKAELFFGAARSAHPTRTLAAQELFVSRFASFPFDDSCAQHYARIRQALAAIGQPIGPNDLLIAAIALANGLTLVTHNVAEFSRIAGLAIEDWEAA